MYKVINIFFYYQVKSMVWWFSNGVVLFGSMAYALVRQREMADQKNKAYSKVSISDNIPQEKVSNLY